MGGARPTATLKRRGPAPLFRPYRTGYRSCFILGWPGPGPPTVNGSYPHPTSLWSYPTSFCTQTVFNKGRPRTSPDLAVPWSGLAQIRLYSRGALCTQRLSDPNLIVRLDTVRYTSLYRHRGTPKRGKPQNPRPDLVASWCSGDARTCPQPPLPSTGVILTRREVRMAYGNTIPGRHTTIRTEAGINTLRGNRVTRGILDRG